MREFPQLSTYNSDWLFDDKSKASEAEELLSWFKGETDYLAKQFLDNKKKEAIEISKEASELVEEVKRFVSSGGKRVRPAFLYSGYVASGGRAHDVIVYASLCVEFLHTFALIHDDIIDRSDTRRGKPTSHKVFEKMHKIKKFKESREHFGLSGAILAGDLASAFAEEILTSSPFPQERVRRARYYFDQMKFQVISGEYLDVLSGYKRRLSEEEILKILEYKTAKYTVERPLQIGAVLAGAEVGVLETFTAYAIPLGQAFQLQDDVLGVFGDPKKMGKSVDSDIREGKKTVLIAKSYEWANSKQRKTLECILGDSDASESDIDEVRQIIYQVGAYEYAVRLSHRLVEQAKDALNQVKLEEKGKNYLLAAADYLLSRV
jgi:geranylgeranyl diphosphate synthase type I